MKIRFILRRFVILMLLLGAAGWALYTYFNPKPVAIVYDSAPSLDLGGPFSLTDQHGKKRSSEEFQGKYKILYFGYSYCPDVCPMGLQNIGLAMKRLERDRQEVVPIFITIDPERDTQDHLHLYASNFHPQFVMLTGTREEIEKVCQNYKVYAAKAQGERSSTDYLIDHSTFVYILGRDGKVLKLFSHSTPGEEIAQFIISCLANEQKTVPLKK